MAEIVEKELISRLIHKNAKQAFLCGIKHKNLREHSAGVLDGCLFSSFYVTGEFSLEINHMLSALNQIRYDVVDHSGMTEDELLEWGLAKSIYGQVTGDPRG
jgi:hypothetical protein